MEKIIFEQTYSDESLVDLGRDVQEAVDGDYNEFLKFLPKDEHGFRKGTFRVTISWKNND